MSMLNCEFLFTIRDQYGKRRVYRMQPSGILNVESPFGSDTYKESYDRFVEAFKEMGYFRKWLNARQGSLYVLQRSFLQKIIARLLTPVPKIFSYGNFLDVGCNTGNFLHALPDPWNRYGVEVNREACQVVKRYPNIRVFNTSLEKFTTPLRFDFVRASHVIEHVEDYERFLEKMYHLMAPKSYALLYTPNTQSFSYVLFKRYWSGFDERTHVNLFNLKNLQALCERYGFIVIATGTYDMGMTAHSLLKLLHINVANTVGYVFFWFLFLALYPFCFIANAFKRDGALYIYLMKDEKKS